MPPPPIASIDAKPPKSSAVQVSCSSDPNSKSKSSLNSNPKSKGAANERAKSNGNSNKSKSKVAKTKDQTTTVTVTVRAADQTEQLKGSAKKLEFGSLDELDRFEAEKMKRRAKCHKTWNRRLKIFFCCLGYKKNKDSIADVASTFAEFYSELDVPSSDLAAGFVLLSKYQEAQRRWVLANNRPKGNPLGHLRFGQPKGPQVEQYLSSVAITRDTRFVDVSQAADCQLVNELIYYMNYSLAIFGWPLQMLDEPHLVCCICPYLRFKSCFGCCCSKTRRQDEHEWPVESPVVLDDNCCGCNLASAERRLAAHNYEVIYVNYRVNVNVVPFLVAADHSKQTIVIAIRGSMSQADMVTDMNGHPDKVPVDNCPDDWLSHRGITQAAKYVHDTIVEFKILEQAFACRPDLASHQYSIVICGHSLGAGAAAILGILLRQKYPDLRAYLYSPPGGILSLPVVEYTKQFATGILLGNDCVPRLGLAQLERLRYYLLLSLKNSNLSTSKILARAFCSTCCFGRTNVDYDPDLSVDVLHGTSGEPFEYNANMIPFQCQKQVLYVPGRLIHVVKNYDQKQASSATASGGWFGRNKTREAATDSKKRRRSPIYQAVWTENTDYDKIMIAEGMLYDHLPNRLMHSMKMLMSKTLPARVGRQEQQQPQQPSGNSPPGLEHADDKSKFRASIRSYRSFERPDSTPVITCDDHKLPRDKYEQLDANNNDDSIKSVEPSKRITQLGHIDSSSSDEYNSNTDHNSNDNDHSNDDDQYHDCNFEAKMATISGTQTTETRGSSEQSTVDSRTLKQVDCKSSDAIDDKKQTDET